MLETPFEEIKKIEAESERALSESEEKCSEILKRAEKERAKIVEDNRKSLELERKKKIQDTLKRAEKFRRESLSKNVVDMKKAKMAAEKKKKDAVDLILHRLSKSIG